MNNYTDSPYLSNSTVYVKMKYLFFASCDVVLTPGIVVVALPGFCSLSF